MKISKIIWMNQIVLKEAYRIKLLYMMSFFVSYASLQWVNGKTKWERGRQRTRDQRSRDHVVDDYKFVVTELSTTSGTLSKKFSWVPNKQDLPHRSCIPSFTLGYCATLSFFSANSFKIFISCRIFAIIEKSCLKIYDCEETCTMSGLCCE